MFFFYILVYNIIIFHSLFQPSDAWSTRTFHRHKAGSLQGTFLISFTLKFRLTLYVHIIHTYIDTIPLIIIALFCQSLSTLYAYSNIYTALALTCPIIIYFEDIYNFSIISNSQYKKKYLKIFHNNIYKLIIFCTFKILQKLYYMILKIHKLYKIIHSFLFFIIHNITSQKWKQNHSYLNFIHVKKSKYMNKQKQKIHGNDNIHNSFRKSYYCWNRKSFNLYIKK